MGSRVLLLTIGIVFTAFLVNCSSKDTKPESSKPKSSSPESVANAADSKEEAKPKPTPAPVVEDTSSDVKLDEIAAVKFEMDPKYTPLKRVYLSRNWAGVYREATKLLSANNKDAVALNALGAFYIQQKKYVAARYFLDLAMKASSGGTAEILNNLGLLDYYEEDLMSAISNFKKAFRKQSKSFNVCFNLGSLYLNYGDFLKALPLLETAYRLRKKSVKAAANFAIALRGTGKIKAAKKVYESAITSEVKSPQVLINYARLLIVDLKEYQEGITVLNRLSLLGSANANQKKVADSLSRLAKKRLN